MISQLTPTSGGGGDRQPCREGGATLLPTLLLASCTVSAALTPRLPSFFPEFRVKDVEGPWMFWWLDHPLAWGMLLTSYFIQTSGDRGTDIGAAKVIQENLQIRKAAPPPPPHSCLRPAVSLWSASRARAQTWGLGPTPLPSPERTATWAINRNDRSIFHPDMNTFPQHSPVQAGAAATGKNKPDADWAPAQPHCPLTLSSLRCHWGLRASRVPGNVTGDWHTAFPGTQFELSVI